MIKKPKKTGLKTREVSKDHFSSNLNKKDFNYNRFLIRLLDGKSLLASDVSTGKSDPVCFIWIGPKNEYPDFNSLSSNDIKNNLNVNKGIYISKVCKTTVDPIWNEDINIPITDVLNLLDYHCVILVRDEDIDEGTNDISYDDLGLLDISFQSIIKNSKLMKNSLICNSKKYELMKAPGMRKVDGSIRLTISLIFTLDDIMDVIKIPELQVNSINELLSKFKAISNDPTISLYNYIPPEDEDLIDNNISEVSISNSNLDFLNMRDKLDSATNQLTSPVIDELEESFYPVAGNENINSENNIIEDKLNDIINQVVDDHNDIDLTNLPIGDQSLEPPDYNASDDLKSIDKEIIKPVVNDKKAETLTNDNIIAKPINNSKSNDMNINNKPINAVNKLNKTTSSIDINPTIKSPTNPTVKPSTNTINSTIKNPSNTNSNPNKANRNDLKSPEVSNSALVDNKSKNINSTNVNSNRQAKSFNNDTNVDNNDNTETIASGSATVAARALRDVAQQRELLKKHLDQLTKVTTEGLLNLSQRIDNIESSSDMKVSSPKPNNLKEFKQKQKKANKFNTTNNNDFTIDLLIKDRNGLVKTARLADNDTADELEDIDIPTPRIKKSKVTNKLPVIHNDEEEELVILPNVNLSEVIDTNKEFDDNRVKSPIKSAKSPERLKNSPAKPKDIQILSGESDVNWHRIEKYYNKNDYISCFNEVFDHGNIYDISKVMEIIGPRPHLLSYTTCNKLYEHITSMIINNIHVDRCLVWIIAIIKSKHKDINIARSYKKSNQILLSNHIIKELIDVLNNISVNKSYNDNKINKLAKLLVNQLDNIMTISNSLPNPRISWN